MAGICPGPAVIACYLYCPQILAFFTSLCLGMYIESLIDAKIADKINNNQLISKVNKFAKLKQEK